MAVLHTLSASYTLEQAQKHEASDLLREFKYPQLSKDFCNKLYLRRHAIEAAAAHHLNINPSRCSAAVLDLWLRGSFNVCVPIDVLGGKRVLMRFPSPYRVGDDFHPGNSDEKLRCEAGAYAWLQEKCPAIPLPQLYGFATSTRQQFTHLDQRGLFSRWYHILRRRILAWAGYAPSLYVRHTTFLPELDDLGVGYLLIEYIDPAKAQMLSNTWNQPDDPRRFNLFRGLAKMLVRLAHLPLPRIGSFTIDDSGFLSLANRPLSYEILNLENQCIATEIPRDQTYANTETFISDTLHMHRNRLRYLRNAAHDVGDCLCQMQSLTLGMSVFQLLFRRDLRNGPFIFQFTDLHQSNILVDDEWNIIKLIDLEFTASMPIEFIDPPYWLSNEAVDVITVESFDRVRSEFMAMIEEEEDTVYGQDRTLSSTMQQSWRTGTFWAVQCLTSATGFYNLFTKRIEPLLFTKDAIELTVSELLWALWGRDCFELSDKKAKDSEDYNKQLEELFDTKWNA